MRKRLSAIATIGSVLTVLAFASPAAAQTTPQASSGGSAMRVAPVRVDITVKPGETKSTDVYVTNVTNAVSELKAVINDFGAGDDESGQPKLYLDENSSAPKHGLKKFVLPIENLTLQSQERKTVRVTVSMPANAAGGGYYGAVRFAPLSSGGGKENVSLSGSVGTLFLVTVPGDVIEKAEIKSFNVARMTNDKEPKISKASNFFTSGSKDAQGKGIQTVLRIENTGNIQVGPFGKVLLKKSGKDIATYDINNVTPRGNVLPESTRRFTVDLGDKTSSFGKYTVVGNFGYGSSGQLLTASSTFWVVPLAYILMGAGLLLVLIAALLFLPRMLRSHDRKLIRKIRSHK